MKNRLVVVGILVALLFAGFAFPTDSYAGGYPCHIVQRGETLAQIAYRYGTTVQAIAALNNITNPNLIYVGQCLQIPGGAPPPPPPPGCTIVHVVQRGEYLKQIAARYGVGWQTIAQYNGLSNPNLIYPGQRLRIPVACPPPKPPPKPTPKPTPKPSPDKPWKGQYWDNRYLSGDPKLVKYYTTIDFNFGTAGPGSPIKGTDFSARFTRSKEMDAGRYKFHIWVDDGVRFWLDGVNLIDQWHESAPTLYTVERDVSAGTHSLQIDFFQALGAAQLKFMIERMDGQAAWKAEFFNNTDLAGAPVTTQYYNSVSFDWGNASPAGGVTADYFSSRFTGDFSFAAGKYRFSATMDDGMRVYVDDARIIDQWTGGAARTFYADVDLSAGVHRIRVEHFEYKGVAVAKVSWVQQ